MTPLVLGLDIGGANLKAATVDKRAVSVPFALWKQPDKLPAALADLVGQFPDAEELAVTMTGELCDCYETKREGVNAILDAVESVAKGIRVRVWGTDNRFMSINRARDMYLQVAAANWHALATFAGRYSTTMTGLLIDTGSTTTDIIPLNGDREHAIGRTDPERLRTGELVYTGVRRTPISSVLIGEVATEFFASTHDAYLLLEWVPENSSDTDTADGRPSTIPHAHARMSRMLCGDPELVSIEETRALATKVMTRQIELFHAALERIRSNVPWIGPLDDSFWWTVIVSGSGWFLGSEFVSRFYPKQTELIVLSDRIGQEAGAAAPAYALAVLATERRP